jgi:hypothetical protein
LAAPDGTLSDKGSQSLEQSLATVADDLFMALQHDLLSLFKVQEKRGVRKREGKG